MKKILIVNDHFEAKGGADIVASNQYKEFLLRGCEVEFFTSEKLLNGKYEFTPKNILKNLFNYNAYKAVKKKIKNYEPDLVIVHSWTKQLSSSIFFASRSKPIHIVAHDYFLNCPNGGFYNFRSKEKCNLIGGSFKCVSENCDKKSYTYKIFRLLRFWIQNLILKDANLTVWCLNSIQYNLNKIKYNAKNLINPIGVINISVGNKNSYAYIGRSDPEKGTSIFENIIIPEGRNLLVIGPTKDDFPIIEKAIYYGWMKQSEIKKKFSSIRACIFTSVWLEVDPLTPFELMTSGIPVISSSSNVFGMWLYEKIPELVYFNIEQLNKIITLLDDEDYYRSITIKVIQITEKEYINRINIYERYINEITN